MWKGTVVLTEWELQVDKEWTWWVSNEPTNNHVIWDAEGREAWLAAVHGVATRDWVTEQQQHLNMGGLYADNSITGTWYEKSKLDVLLTGVRAAILVRQFSEQSRLLMLYKALGKHVLKSLADFLKIKI